MRRLLLLALAGACAAFVVNQQSEKDVVDQVLSKKIPEFAKHLTGKALEDYLNKAQTYFKVGPNKLSLAEMKAKVMETKYVAPPKNVTVKRTVAATIPDSFDARDAWPACADSIGFIRDQANCGSCWAFAAAESMSDRICIASAGASIPVLSADDMLSCCSPNCGNGCGGGYIIAAWQYWAQTGIVSGGLYGDTSTCRPYEISPCGYHQNEPFYRDCPAGDEQTPACVQQCQDSYPSDYNSDLTVGASAYAIDSNVAAIQTEIMTNGPVEAGYTVYSDFYNYQSGVYVHTGGTKVGGHAVKIIGWGVDATTSTPYWLVANSWNTDWGENGGYFRIIRGTNECGFESSVAAGMPSV